MSTFSQEQQSASQWEKTFSKPDCLLHLPVRTWVFCRFCSRNWYFIDVHGAAANNNKECRVRHLTELQGRKNQTRCWNFKHSSTNHIQFVHFNAFFPLGKHLTIKARALGRSKNLIWLLLLLKLGDGLALLQRTLRLPGVQTAAASSRCRETLRGPFNKRKQVKNRLSS